MAIILHSEDKTSGTNSAAKFTLPNSISGQFSLTHHRIEAGNFDWTTINQTKVSVRRISTNITVDVLLPQIREPTIANMNLDLFTMFDVFSNVTSVTHNTGTNEHTINLSEAYDIFWEVSPGFITFDRFQNEIGVTSFQITRTHMVNRPKFLRLFIKPNDIGVLTFSNRDHNIVIATDGDTIRFNIVKFLATLSIEIGWEHEIYPLEEFKTMPAWTLRLDPIGVKDLSNIDRSKYLSDLGAQFISTHKKAVSANNDNARRRGQSRDRS